MYVLTTDGVEVREASQFGGQASGPIFLDQLMCSGEEESLMDCRMYEEPGVHMCSHQHDVGVICQRKALQCMCRSTICLYTCRTFYTCVVHVHVMYNLFTYIYVCMVCSDTCTCTCTYVHTRTHMYVRTYVPMYIPMYVRTYMYMYVHVQRNTYTHKYTRMHTYVCTCTQQETCTYTHADTAL